MRSLIVISAVAWALVSSTTATANEQQRSELRKQLEIMNGIFNTTLEQQEQAASGEFRSRLSYNYLAGQGVVYSAKIGGGRMMFFDGGVPMPPMPNMPDLPHLSDVESIEIETAVAEGLAAAGEALEHIEIIIEDENSEGERIEVVREVSREMRDHAHEVRDLRRRVRDLELAKNANEGDAQSIERELEQAKQELAEREQEISVARAELKQARVKLKAKMADRKAKQEERKTKQLAALEQAMATTLCDYGRTLRALPASENVNFVVEGASSESGSKAKVFIFSKQQLENCSSASDLLKQATTYSF